MSETKLEAQPEGAGDVPVEAPKDQTTAQRFTETIEEAKGKLAENAATENLPAELEGMDKASLDKYYKDGEFDWASYGKEQAFKAKQTATEPAETAETEGEEAANEPAKEGITNEENDKIKAATEAAGVDFEAAANSIIENGDLSVDDRKKLVDSGIPEFVIDDYVRLMVTDINSRVAQTIESLGGEEEFNSIFDGLQQNATEDQRNQIDDLLRDPATFNAGIQLARDLSGVGGENPAPAPAQEITGGRNQAAPTAPAVQGFASFEEQMTAQRDPKYNNDPAYRDEVMRKIAASTYTVNPRAHTGGL